MIDLLERDDALEQLSHFLSTARSGHGRTVLISGEAGIGKTALVEHFAHQQSRAAGYLWGACEALFTPCPLGPLYDIATQVGGRLAQLLRSTPEQAILFHAVLAELQQRPSPTIVVFEDVHWADEATFDLIKFLGRRITSLPVLFLITYRDSELKADHPLRSAIGDLPGKAVARLQLAPLSEQAVISLAKRAQRSVAGLYDTTRGNPFFVSEVLASETEGVPLSVCDAVLARITRFSVEARMVLELASVVPTHTEHWLLEAILGSAWQAVEECVTSGLLDLSPTTVVFRHELARQAIESTLSPLRKQALHRQILQSLLSREADTSLTARLAHHATATHDGALVLRYASQAARQASAQGAHRQAAEHYRNILKYANLLEAADHQELHAAFLDGLAHECSLTGQTEEAFQAHLAALDLWRRLDRPAQIGHTLSCLSEHCWHLGLGRDSYRYALEAVEFLEGLPLSRELGQAYANLSGLYMMSSDSTQAMVWGQRAMNVAQQFYDVQTECHALVNIGSVTFYSGDEKGQVTLEQSLQLAREQGFEKVAALAYMNLVDNLIRSRIYAQAESYLQEGLSYCIEHNLDAFGLALRAMRARAYFDRGDWVRAEEDVTAILSIQGISVTNRIAALLILSLLRLRRGDPGAQQTLDELRDLAAATGEIQYMAPVAAARAEWWWLQGQHEQCTAEAAEGFRMALPCERPWHLGEVAIWLWRGGEMLKVPEGALAQPFALQIAGDWRGAAALWEQIGCPYEQALALSDGDVTAQVEALMLLERLGARPMVALMRRQLRRQGVVNVPRGPRPSTSANEAGLTSRQREVLQLMARGLSNAEIASRLFTSLKTTEHHVSAVLAKLGVHSRMHAIQMIQPELIVHQDQSAVP